MTSEIGPGQRENCNQQQQNLQDKEPVMPQTLERRAGLRLRKKFLPEQSARYQPHNPFALEQIKQDHHRNRGGEKKSPWRDEVHPHTSASRNCFKSSFSSEASL